MNETAEIKTAVVRTPSEAEVTDGVVMLLSRTGWTEPPYGLYS